VQVRSGQGQGAKQQVGSKNHKDAVRAGMTKVQWLWHHCLHMQQTCGIAATVC
jgi:hypothetical protein